MSSSSSAAAAVAATAAAAAAAPAAEPQPEPEPNNNNSQVSVDQITAQLQQVILGPVNHIINLPAIGPSAGATGAAEAATSDRRPFVNGAATRPSRDAEARAYVVWDVPGRPELRGIHFGSHPLTWNSLNGRLPGGQYEGSGAHLCQCLEPTVEAATAVYEREALRHGCPRIPRIHYY